jgi:hypothetical protein
VRGRVLTLLLLACGDDVSLPRPDQVGVEGTLDGGVSDGARVDPKREADGLPTTPAEPSGLSGLWRFEQRFRYVSEQEYTTLELLQSGTVITGKQCDARYEPSGEGVRLLSATCIEQTFSGTFVEPDLHLTRQFEEEGQVHTYTLDLVSTADSARFEGGGHSTKCECSFEVTAVRAVMAP